MSAAAVNGKSAGLPYIVPKVKLSFPLEVSGLMRRVHLLKNKFFVMGDPESNAIVSNLQIVIRILRNTTSKEHLDQLSKDISLIEAQLKAKEEEDIKRNAHFFHQIRTRLDPLIVASPLTGRKPIASSSPTGHTRQVSKSRAHRTEREHKRQVSKGGNLQVPSPTRSSRPPSAASSDQLRPMSRGDSKSPRPSSAASGESLRPVFTNLAMTSSTPRSPDQDRSARFMVLKPVQVSKLSAAGANLVNRQVSSKARTLLGS